MRNKVKGFLSSGFPEAMASTCDFNKLKKSNGLSSGSQSGVHVALQTALLTAIFCS
jgi:hypothetical protein